MNYVYSVGEQYEDDTGVLWEVCFVFLNGYAEVHVPGQSGWQRFQYDAQGVSLQGLPSIARLHVPAALQTYITGACTPTCNPATGSHTQWCTRCIHYGVPHPFPSLVASPHVPAFKVGDRVSIMGGGSGTIIRAAPGLDIYDILWDNGATGMALNGHHLTLIPAVPAFKVGDRVQERGGSREGIITNAVALAGRWRVEWDDGQSGTYPEAYLGLDDSRPGLSRAQVGTKCECGALKAKTTHATWCPLHESGGKPAFKMPDKLSF